MDMEGIDTQIEDTLDLIKSEVYNYRRRSGVQKEVIEEKLRQLLRDCKDQIKDYKTMISESRESREHDDWKRDIAVHKKKVRNFYETYSKQKKLFQKLSEEAKKNELLQDAEDRDDMDQHKQKQIQQKLEDGEDLTNDEISDQLFADVFKIQDQNVALVEQLLLKADKANEQAANINEKLAMQNEQLIDISHELDHLGGIIKRAGREVTSFMRGLATDKIFVVCCCLCVCVVMIVIVAFVICRCYVCTLICDALGDDAVKKCKKIPLLYTGTGGKSKNPLK